MCLLLLLWQIPQTGGSNQDPSFSRGRGWESEARGRRGRFLLRPRSSLACRCPSPSSSPGLPSAHLCPHFFL